MNEIAHTNARPDAGPADAPLDPARAAATDRDGTRFWGALPEGDGSWSFALWSPSARTVSLELDGQLHPMQRDGADVFRTVQPARAGDAYSLVVDGVRLVDPAARQLLNGVDGPALLVDPQALRQNRAGWPGRPYADTVISELHIGTFTPEGTFAAAARSEHLAALAEMGITTLELMPIGAFPGRMGWGYDVALPHAPFSPYGSPADLCALIDRAHELGMSIILDVVFNHFGPLGCPLPQICPEFFTAAQTEWGQAINFAQPAVRAYFTQCALGWLEDYGFDGLRLDAIDQIQDDSNPHYLVELAQTLRARLPERQLHLMTEDKRNITALHQPEARLYDGEWNDDYHHAMHVLLTGETFLHYAAFAADPLDDLATALRDGFVLQGQPRPAGGEVKGEPSGHLPWRCFVNFNCNHDQAGNRAKGSRLVSLAGHEKALVAHALLLTAPFTPLLLMGEECGSEAPFPWLADFPEPQASEMRQGRVRQHEDIPDFAAEMVDPMDPAIWASCDPYARLPLEAPSWRAETARLLALRRETLMPLWRSGPAGPAETRVIGAKALWVQWPCVLGTVQAAFCLDGSSSWSDPGALRPIYHMRAPGSGHPWFQLWVMPRDAADHAIASAAREQMPAPDLYAV